MDWYSGIPKKTIFLYLIVVNDDVGQYIVASMVSEAHTTSSIQFFFNEWIRLGAPIPKEFTCDGSYAILNAAVQTFTRFFTVKEYAAACENELPSCYIRLDVAHFIKLYANFLKTATKSKKIRVFYKASMGQLILCRNIEKAAKVLKGILIVAYCDTDGHLLDSDQETECDKQRKFLKNLLNPQELEESDDGENEDIPEYRPPDKNIFDYLGQANNEKSLNFWQTWARDIDREARKISEFEVGDHDNAFYLPELAIRILRDIELFPLWSCIIRDRFGYGKIPASSAPVESQIKDLKKDVSCVKSSLLRVDDFVDKLLTYVAGRSNLIEANLLELEEARVSKIDETETDTSKDEYFIDEQEIIICIQSTESTEVPINCGILKGINDFKGIN